MQILDAVVQVFLTIVQKYFGSSNSHEIPDYFAVRATTRTGYMMTSPKFSTWCPNQGTRSRVTFQLFATESTR